jgi:L-ascorbate metabolism protein UlaG (beta-lactamase superfamily)
VPSGGDGPNGGLAVTWLGHATALIELDGVRLLTDPVLGPRVGPLVRVGARARLDVPAGLEAVLLSHLHADHAHLRSLRMLEVPRVFAPRGSGRWLARRGVANVEELGPGERAQIGPVALLATPARHEGRRWRYGPSGTPMGMLVEASRSCYFAGDTDLFAEMAELAGVDLALLPVAGWGHKVGSGHLDPARAAEAVRLIAPRVAVPIHWGTLAPFWWRGRRPDAERPAQEFAELVQASTPEVEVRVLAPGSRTVVDRPRALPGAGDL